MTGSTREKSTLLHNILHHHDSLSLKKYSFQPFFFWSVSYNIIFSVVLFKIKINKKVKPEVMREKVSTKGL